MQAWCGRGACSAHTCSCKHSCNALCCPAAVVIVRECGVGCHDAVLQASGSSGPAPRRTAASGRAMAWAEGSSQKAACQEAR